MNQKDLIALGIPPGEAMRRGLEFINRYLLKGLDKSALPAQVTSVVTIPSSIRRTRLARLSDT